MKHSENLCLEEVQNQGNIMSIVKFKRKDGLSNGFSGTLGSGKYNDGNTTYKKKDGLRKYSHLPEDSKRKAFNNLKRFGDKRRQSP